MKYRVYQQVSIGEQIYEPGSTIELSEEDGKSLVELGSIVPIQDESAEVEIESSASDDFAALEDTQE